MGRVVNVVMSYHKAAVTLRYNQELCKAPENSVVLNGNFDLSAIDHIWQLENPHYCYTCRSCTLM